VHAGCHAGVLVRETRSGRDLLDTRPVSGRRRRARVVTRPGRSPVEESRWAQLWDAGSATPAAS